MEESESTYVDGDVDKFIEQLEQGLFEQQWIRDRLAVIKQNEEYRWFLTLASNSTALPLPTPEW